MTLLGKLAPSRWPHNLYAVRMRLAGVDLAGVSVAELGLPPDRAHLHAHSGGPVLETLLRRLSIPPGSRVLDLGCGKGGACFTLAEHFSDVVGVDLSADLIRIAHRNAHRICTTNVRFMVGDAATFTDLDRFSHLYLFNPFPIAVAQAFMANLRASLERSQRPLTLIYKFPGCPCAFVDRELFDACDVITVPLRRYDVNQWKTWQQLLLLAFGALLPLSMFAAGLFSAVRTWL